MKIGIFTDPHYSSREVSCKRRYNSLSLRKIGEAMEDFVARGCDFAVCLGDVIDTEAEHEKETENLRAVGQLLDRFDLPCYCVMGNHDGFRFPVEEFYGILGEAHRPRDFSAEGKTFLFLDACYHRDGAHYAPGRSDWTDVAYPHGKELENRLRTAEGEVFLFLHQNLDPGVEARHVLANAEAIRAAISSCGKVKAVFQGHYHPGNENRVDGILYRTFPAMCEAEKCWFILDL